MKIAYLILAHINPKLINRMVGLLSSETSGFFIHVDKKSNIDDFSLIKGSNVCFIDKRIPVYWSEYSIVEAILNLIQQAIDSPESYDYCVLLSGSDYPLRSKEYIHNFFAEHKGEEFISLINIDAEEVRAKRDPCLAFIARKYCSYLNTFRISASRPVLRYVVKILARLGLAHRDYRKYLGSLKPYCGSMWWALTRDACKYILDFAKTNQSICEYYQNTFVSDEMLFHTILGNSKFRPMIRKSLTFADFLHADNKHGMPPRQKFLEWGSHKGGHPVPIGEKHIMLFEKNNEVIVDDIYGSGEMLFARKFSDDRLDLIGRIEAMIESKEQRRKM